MNPQNIKVFIKSFLLKVTEILDKMSQFETLAMTEKNVFAYILFCHYKESPPPVERGAGEGAHYAKEG